MFAHQNITEEQFKVEELPECCAVAVVATNAAGTGEPSYTFHSCRSFMHEDNYHVHWFETLYCQISHVMTVINISQARGGSI